MYIYIVINLVEYVARLLQEEQGVPACIQSIARSVGLCRCQGFLSDTFAWYAGLKVLRTYSSRMNFANSFLRAITTRISSCLFVWE